MPSTVVPDPLFTLRRLTGGEQDAYLARGGSVVYAAHSCADGRRIGFVGDARAWKGHRYGACVWWAAWREPGDTSARWNTFDGPEPRTRAEAVLALREQLARA